MPLPFAAWLTNAAYDCAANLCIAVIDIDKDAQEHQDVYVGVVNQLNIVFASSPTDSKYDDFTQGHGMTFPWDSDRLFQDRMEPEPGLTSKKWLARSN